MSTGGHSTAHGRAPASFWQCWPVGPSTLFPSAWLSLRAELPRCLDLEADGTGPLPDPRLSLCGSILLAYQGVAKVHPVRCGSWYDIHSLSLAPARETHTWETEARIKGRGQRLGPDLGIHSATQGALVSIWQVRKLRPTVGKEQLQGHGPHKEGAI